MNKRSIYFKYNGFYVVSLILMLFGIILQPGKPMLEGMKAIYLAPGVLISDFMAIGGVGAAFFNSGLTLFSVVLFAHKMGARITGALVASLFTVAGFSFFGKTLLNSIPLIIGVYLYAKVTDLKFSDMLHVAYFSTGIAPAVSFVIFGLGLPFALSIPAGILAGLIIGFVVTPLSGSMLAFHHGYNLYNVGFTIGIAGIAFAGILRMFDFEVKTVRFIYEGDDLIMRGFMLFLSLSLMAYGLYRNGGIKGYDKILKRSGRLVSDFVIENHMGLVLFNMGLLGLLTTLYVILVQGPMNGPVMGGIFTVMGFAAFGKQPKNIIPIILGVFLTSLLNKYDVGSTDAILVALFGTTISPVAGHYGFLAGLAAGFLHKGISTNIGFAHGGMNLYNNGLAGGLAAGIIVPILEFIVKRREEREQRKG